VLFTVRSESDEGLFALPFQEIWDCCSDSEFKPLARPFRELQWTAKPSGQEESFLNCKWRRAF